MSSPILNSAEMLVLQDKAFFYTKATIDGKISDLFDALKREIESLVKENNNVLPNELFARPGRQYRGENLNALPWRALDCPRVFAGEDMFCFRALLVWGEEFSFHLLLSGTWREQFLPALAAAHPLLAAAGWELSLQDSPWDWTRNQDEFQSLSLVSQADFERLLGARDWCKLSVSHSLGAFDEVPSRGAELFASLLAALQ